MEDLRRVEGFLVDFGGKTITSFRLGSFSPIAGDDPERNKNDVKESLFLIFLSKLLNTTLASFGGEI